MKTTNDQPFDGSILQRTLGVHVARVTRQGTRPVPPSRIHWFQICLGVGVALGFYLYYFAGD